MRIRCMLSLGLAALIFSVAAVKAEEATKLKVPEIKVDAKAKKDAECKIDAAKKDAECKMQQSKEQAEKMKQKQLKKADEMKKEAAKGSEKGQAMREEHSKKWWKFWGEKAPAAPTK